jgi:DNA topoisomerase-3
VLDREHKLLFEQKAPEELRCPLCKSGLIIKGNTAWGCSEYRKGCQLRIPFVFKGKELTDSQMKQLILKWKTNNISLLNI